MTTLLHRSVALIIFAICSFANANESSALRVVSFNIRFTNPNDGTNSWDLRRELFFGEVQRLAPVLIGFQEVRPDQYEEIVSRLKKDFDFVGGGREDGKNEGERALIGFDKKRFKKIKTGDFWLSENPDVPGSKSWDTAITRVCTWVLLKDQAANRELLFVNTHFDHKGVVARENSARMLATKLPELARENPIILTGDFNFNEDSPAYAALLKRNDAGKPWLIDSYRALHPQRSPDEASFNGFKGVKTGSRIDFILHSPEIKPVASSIERFATPDGRYPSDHYPVAAVLEFTK